MLVVTAWPSLPSCPSPQHLTLPFTSSAQECLMPHAIALTLPPTGTSPAADGRSDAPTVYVFPYPAGDGWERAGSQCAHRVCDTCSCLALHPPSCP